MSLLIGSLALGAVVVVFFLSKFRCDLPLRNRLKDSRRDFFKDLRRDIGLSSELAMSAARDTVKVQYSNQGDVLTQPGKSGRTL